MMNRFIGLFAFLFMFATTAEAKVHSYDKKNAIGFFKQGTIALSENRFGDAVSAFEAAIKNAPDAARLYVNLGTTWLSLKRCERAVRNYHIYLSIAPDGVYAGRVKEALGECVGVPPISGKEWGILELPVSESSFEVGGIVLNSENSREIVLSVGVHLVKMSSASSVYSGSIEIKVAGRIKLNVERDLKAVTAIPVAIATVAPKAAKQIPENVSQDPPEAMKLTADALAEIDSNKIVESANPPESSINFYAWSMLGAGVVASTVGIIYGMTAQDTNDKSKKLSSEDPQQSSLRSDYDSQRSIGITSLSLGLAALAGGTAWIYWSNGKKKSTASQWWVQFNGSIQLGGKF
jgi:tetratricopeptide (TPR) repeat protein